MSALNPLPAAANSARPETRPEARPEARPETRDAARLRQAAQGFEAMFVRQMLSAARAASLAGKDPLFGGQSQETFAAMRDERFAEIAASTGAFGLAKQLEAQLARVLPTKPATAATQD